MFEYWSDEFSESLRRVVDPPKQVLLDLSIAIGPPQGAFRKDEVSLRIKQAGLDLTEVVPGWLYAWAQCTDGSWIGLVGFAIPTSQKGKGRIETKQWCAMRAISERDSSNRRR